MNRNVYEPADSLIFRKVSKIVRLAMKPPRHRVAPCSTMDVLFSCCLWSAGGVSAMKGRRFKQGVRSFMVDVLASVQKTLRSCTSCHRQSSSIFISYLSINRSIDLSINICIYIIKYTYIYIFIYLQLYIYIYIDIYYLVVSSIFHYIPFFSRFLQPGWIKTTFGAPQDTFHLDFGSAASAVENLEWPLHTDALMAAGRIWGWDVGGDGSWVWVQSGI